MPSCIGDGQGGGSRAMAIHAYYDQGGIRNDRQKKATKELESK